MKVERPLLAVCKKIDYLHTMRGYIVPHVVSDAADFLNLHDIDIPQWADSNDISENIEFISDWEFMALSAATRPIASRLTPRFIELLVNIGHQNQEIWALTTRGKPGHFR